MVSFTKILSFCFILLLLSAVAVSTDGNPKDVSKDVDSSSKDLDNDEKDMALDDDMDEVDEEGLADDEESSKKIDFKDMVAERGGYPPYRRYRCENYCYYGYGARRKARYACRKRTAKCTYYRHRYSRCKVMRCKYYYGHGHHYYKTGWKCGCPY